MDEDQLLLVHLAVRRGRITDQPCSGRCREQRSKSEARAGRLTVAEPTTVNLIKKPMANDHISLLSVCLGQRYESILRQVKTQERVNAAENSITRRAMRRTQNGINGDDYRAH